MLGKAIVVSVHFWWNFSFFQNYSAENPPLILCPIVQTKKAVSVRRSFAWQKLSDDSSSDRNCQARNRLTETCHKRSLTTGAEKKLQVVKKRNSTKKTWCGLIPYRLRLASVSKEKDHGFVTILLARLPATTGELARWKELYDVLVKKRNLT